MSHAAGVKHKRRARAATTAANGGVAPAGAEAPSVAVSEDSLSIDVSYAALMYMNVCTCISPSHECVRAAVGGQPRSRPQAPSTVAIVIGAFVIVG